LFAEKEAFKRKETKAKKLAKLRKNYELEFGSLATATRTLANKPKSILLSQF